VDALVADIKRLWEALNVHYDGFIRTTDPIHTVRVQQIFKALYDKGDIYKSRYEGLYCAPCESFWTQSQLKDGKCPDCGREVIPASEEAYFFRLSKYADFLTKLLSETDFLLPESSRNEMINNFIKPGLTDLCVSRTSFKWGIPVTFDEKHVVYVWIDALSNYITALGYPDGGAGINGEKGLFGKFWPADVHMVGKEIVRFHSIIWPAILHALDLPMPKTVYGHGWLLFGGDKMSKSKGNIADPFPMIEQYGADAVRYYLLREVPFGSDGVYTDENFKHRFNADLANDLGNLVNRFAAMLIKYFGGKIPERGRAEDIDKSLIEIAENAYARVEEEMTALRIPKALEEIFKVVGRANKYIDETMPWALDKAGDKRRLSAVMYNLAESIRISAVLLSPFLTSAPQKILRCLGVSGALAEYDSVKRFGGIRPGTEVTKCEALFPRIQ
jgi:methionyl-tRNA synthetase